MRNITVIFLLLLAIGVAYAENSYNWVRPSGGNVTNVFNNSDINGTSISVREVFASELINGSAFGTGNVIANEFDMVLGGDYGAMKVGAMQIFITNLTIAGLNLNGTAVWRNMFTGHEPEIEFVWATSDNLIRLAMPKAGAALATYNPRSFMVGGDLGQAFSAGIVNCTTQGYTHIDCDTTATGADLGVHDDLEVRGDSFIEGNETVAGQLLYNSTKLQDFCSWNAPTTLNQPLRWNSTGNCIAYYPAGQLASVNTMHFSVANTTSITYEATTDTHNLTLVATAFAAEYHVQGQLMASGGESPCRWTIEIKKNDGTTIATTGVSELASNSGFSDYIKPFHLVGIDPDGASGDSYKTTVTEDETQCSLTVDMAALYYLGG